MSPSTKRASSGNSSIRCGATSLSAVLAGVSLAASGIQTSQTAMARCSFQPYTQPCQPDLVQWASVSIELWGTLPAFLSFLCHTPPFACKTVLSRASALPLLSQGLSTSTRWRPRQPICSGMLSGKALRQRIRATQSLMRSEGMTDGENHRDLLTRLSTALAMTEAAYLEVRVGAIFDLP